MNANELMMGDFVNLCYRDLVLKVLEIGKNAILVETQDNFKLPIHYDETEILPIPLTAEILEKNGWKKSSVDSIHYSYIIKASTDVFARLRLRGICVGDFKPYIDTLSGEKEINYVHELQHALRLCGLNDLADGLKL